jgi:uncharacterized membrane protein YdjX (TVP38/TMEM64 family)
LKQRPQHHHLLRKLLLSIWLILLTLAVWFWWRIGIPPTEVPLRLEAWLRQFGLGQAALCYVIFYALRPLVLFPASLLTITSGLLFGPWLGILFTIIGENASANVAFLLGRWFGRDWVAQHESARMQQWDTRLRENGLVTVLLMRLLYLPFDAVNYGCGLTSMRHRDFFFGTLIGILPSLIGFVLLGGAAHAGEHRPLVIFGLSLGFIVLGLLLARLLKNRGPGDDLSGPPA